MAISGNKGEWSEIYVLFKLLGEGKLDAGDANLKKLSIYYPILNIIREESKRYEYKPNDDKKIVVINEDGKRYAEIPMSKFLTESKDLFNEIKSASETSFTVPNAEAFMSQIGCSKLKAPAKDKADIHIVLHDFRTGMQPDLGFSIKSQLGSASTLLNAGDPTNITYIITGKQLDDKEINEINSIKGHLPRMEAILKAGCVLKYHNIEHSIFKNNLLFLDTCMPEFIARCLIIDSLPGSTSTIKESVDKVANENPFNYSGSNRLAFYEHKMKVLLLDAALGMTPAKEWSGKYDANGGYIVVRKDGEIVCYHFYNRNDVEDYLYNNTRFERASRTRHEFGSLYRGADSKVYIKLNLQIRFTK